ncbi:hypothetical protein Tco_1338639 [Tanacetum coccineum]
MFSSEPVLDIHDPTNGDILDDIDLKDDAELIIPYKVEGDKTPPPGDVSSDSVSSDSELEDEEVDVAPEATAGTITKSLMLFATFRGAYLR